MANSVTADSSLRECIIDLFEDGMRYPDIIGEAMALKTPEGRGLLANMQTLQNTPLETLRDTFKGMGMSVERDAQHHDRLAEALVAHRYRHHIPVVASVGGEVTQVIRLEISTTPRIPNMYKVLPMEGCDGTVLPMVRRPPFKYCHGLSGCCVIGSRDEWPFIRSWMVHFRLCHLQDYVDKRVENGYACWECTTVRDTTTDGSELMRHVWDVHMPLHTVEVDSD